MIETTKLLATIRETAELQLLAMGYHLTGEEVDNLARNVAQTVVLAIDPAPDADLRGLVDAMRAIAPQAVYMSINLYPAGRVGFSFQTADDPALVELANVMQARVQTVTWNGNHWLEAETTRGSWTINVTGPHRPIPEALAEAVELGAVRT